MLKNGCYLQVHFTDEQKKKLRDFALLVGKPQSRVVEEILNIELDFYIYDYHRRFKINECSN